MFLDEPRDILSQGDLIAGVQVPDVEELATTTRPIRAVVLSHDCELASPKLQGLARHALVAEVRPPEDAADGGLWGMIKQARVWNALHIPAGDHHDEAFIDFRRVYRVEKAVLQEAIERGQRLACASDDGREAIVYALLSFLLHEELIPEGGMSQGL
jgi:hypothetical protein